MPINFRLAHYCLIPILLLDPLGRSVSLLNLLSINRFAEYQRIDSTYLGYKGKLIPVPFSDTELVKSGLTSFTNKSKIRKLFMYIAKYNSQDPSTHEGIPVQNIKFRDLLNHFKVALDNCDFFGYGLSLASTERFRLITSL